MAVTAAEQKKRSRKQISGGGGAGGVGTPATAKRRKHTEVRVVGGRIYDPENGKTCHQCRQKTMDFVAACKNLAKDKDKPCTFKYCHKCLINRYGEKAEDMAVVDDWKCPKCRGICNCSFCMKKRGHQPTGILVHTARSTGFSSVSELLHVNGSENVGVAKILQGIDMRPAKHTASGNDRVALSPLKQDDNTSIENQQKLKHGLSKDNQDCEKTKHGRSKKLLNKKKHDVNHEDVALLLEVNARMTRSGGKLKTQDKILEKKLSANESKPDKPQTAKEDLKDTPQYPESNEIPTKQARKKVSLVSNAASKKEVKASQKVEVLKGEKKLEKIDSNADKLQTAKEGPKDTPHDQESNEIPTKQARKKVSLVSNAASNKEVKASQKVEVLKGEKKLEKIDSNADKPQTAKEGPKDTPHDQESNEIPTKQARKKVSFVSNAASNKEVKASQKVEVLKGEKKLEKIDSNNLPCQKTECEIGKQKISKLLKKLDKDKTNLEIVVEFPKQQTDHAELPNKDAIADIELPKGSELTTIAGVELKPEDAGHALQFLEFCAAFGKILNLKKGEPEYVLRELITGGRARRGKISAVVQFHIQLVSLLLEELGENSTLEDLANGRTSWVSALKDCASQCALKKLKLDQLGKGSDNYDSFNTSEKLVLLNFVCDELLCTEKLRSWIEDQNSKCSEKMKEAKEKVLAAKQKEKQLKQKMQDELVKAIISKNGAPLTISDHDAIVSQIKSETALAHAELLEAQGIVPDEKQKSEAVRTQPIIYDANGHIYWKLNRQANESNILLQDLGTWDADGSGEKWFIYTAEQEKVIKEYTTALRKKRLSSQVTRKQSRARTAPRIE